MNDIFTICIDGLHNNGKSTQLKLLKDHLVREGVPTIVRRGDGMRSGLGRDETDPVSLWWQENIARLRATGFEGCDSMRAAEEAANRLNREIQTTKTFWMPKLLNKECKHMGVILLDRGIVSRLFVARREQPDAGLREIGYFDDRRGRHEIALPDLIFLLRAPLDTLLSRNLNRDNIKAKFNDTVLTRYYPDFEEVLANLPKEITEKTLIIDSRKSIEEVQDIIWSHTANIIFGQRNKEGGNNLGTERL